jgi:hypothetical protein
MGSDTTVDLAARIGGATTDIASRVTGAIRDAARVTGAGFEYLLNTAVRESNLNPNAKSPNSSATGLFQFLDQTWLATVKQAGPNLGYGKYADAITQNASGRFTVTDPAMLRDIMALRKDPSANAVMAGAFSNANAKVLTERLGRKPSDGELYIAHFLGAAGAVRLISAAQTQPNTSAASLFPKAAAANSPIFYDKAGTARSLSQVYNVLVAKHDSGATRLAAKPANTATTTALATPPAAPATRAAPMPAAPPLIAAANDTVLPATATAYAAEAAQAAPQRAAGPMFHGLFHEGGRGAVAPVVRELWGVRHGVTTETATAVAPVTPGTQTTAPIPNRVNAPMNLFQFLRPDARGAA